MKKSELVQLIKEVINEETPKREFKDFRNHKASDVPVGYSFNPKKPITMSPKAKQMLAVYWSKNADALEAEDDIKYDRSIGREITDTQREWLQKYRWGRDKALTYLQDNRFIIYNKK